MNFDPIGNSSQQLCRQSTALPFHSIRFEYQINTALDSIEKKDNFESCWSGAVFFIL